MTTKAQRHRAAVKAVAAHLEDLGYHPETSEHFAAEILETARLDLARHVLKLLRAA